MLFFSGQNPVQLGEKKVRFIVSVGISLDIFHLALIVIFAPYLAQITINEFLYFANNFKIVWSSYSISFFIFCIGLISLVARFSSIYLHRERYFYKFFALLYLLELAVFLLILTSSSESIFIGWELLGLCSVLLIAFYEHRMAVLKNSLIILVIYKFADIIFYSALITSAYFDKHIYTQIANPTTLGFILLACLIKSSVFPFVWLPRAMEGPTPSSAIFYGGLATHIPMFIFLNIALNHPNFNPMFNFIMCSLLLAASFMTNLMSKIATDAKSAIAYSSITQLTLVYIEILLGFYTLALIHGMANGVYRSFNFLKSPSLIYQKHHVENRRHHHALKARSKSLVPKYLKNYLFHLAYHDFYLPRMIIYSIELFLGLYNSQTRKHSIRNYLIISLSLFILFEICIYCFLHLKVGIFDESLLLLGLGFNFIATLYKYKPLHFFAVLCASTITIFTTLFEHLHNFTLHLELGFFIVMFYFIVDLIIHGIRLEARFNYTGRFYKTPFYNLLVLFVGISVIGIPGLTSYIIWERLQQELLPYYPNLIMEGFFILALNTIIFFRFYYANFLGKQAETQHYEVIKRI
ncbi:MAG: hypothetical protein A3F18_00500 [Legionellales bacterium RIFCSPHIGHO2_12_FULL_37_14]|nr:MAG: hypothetical protein A3F18_00500 [Legionellales bacterium RIFCSPHIGHO2_12_FULL_37_14]